MTLHFIILNFGAPFTTVDKPVVILHSVKTNTGTGSKTLATDVFCLPTSTELNSFKISTSGLSGNHQYQIAYHVIGRQ
jgi:hypothetical protein